MTDEQSGHKLLSHILLSTFACYEYAENMKNNSKNQTNLDLVMKIDISKSTTLMLLSYFLASLAINITINTVFLEAKPHTNSTMVPALLIRFIL